MAELLVAGPLEAAARPARRSPSADSGRGWIATADGSAEIPAISAGSTPGSVDALAGHQADAACRRGGGRGRRGSAARRGRTTAGRRRPAASARRRRGSASSRRGRGGPRRRRCRRDRVLAGRGLEEARRPAPRRRPARRRCRARRDRALEELANDAEGEIDLELAAAGRVRPRSRTRPPARPIAPSSALLPMPAVPSTAIVRPSPRSIASSAPPAAFSSASRSTSPSTRPSVTTGGPYKRSADGAMTGKGRRGDSPAGLCKPPPLVRRRSTSIGWFAWNSPRGRRWRGSRGGGSATARRRSPPGSTRCSAKFR